MTDSITVPAFAKVNLYLAVLGKRPDGYHELETLFERIDLQDQVAITLSSGSGIEFHCDDATLPQDANNLVVRATENYQRQADWPVGLSIRLTKQIPSAAGMGGGSSDAAATLLALQQLAPRPLTQEQLYQCGRALGADVPFFLMEKPFALGKGRGDELEEVDFPARLFHLCVTPEEASPTPAVYQALQSTPTPTGGLTSVTADARLLFRALREENLPKVRETLYNALEPTVEQLCPVIREVKAVIEKVGGLKRPCVSGSGSTVFALAASRQEADVAAEAVSQAAPRWRVRVAATQA